jgi:hypothetical protein
VKLAFIAQGVAFPADTLWQASGVTRAGFYGLEEAFRACLLAGVRNRGYSLKYTGELRGVVHAAVFC